MEFLPLMLLLGCPIVIMVVCSIYSSIKDKGVAEGRAAVRRELENDIRSLEKAKAEHKKQVEYTENYQKNNEAYIEQKRREMLDDVERIKSHAYHEAEAIRKRASSELERARHIEDLIDKERKLIAKASEDALAVAPYASDMISDYILAHDLHIADILETKARPAYKAAETVREYSLAKHETEKQLRLCRYRLSVFEHFFPWVNDYDDLTVAELKKITTANDQTVDAEDPIKQYITSTEYLTMTDAQRNQLALDRYLASHKKTKWEIGRDYELYVGYLFAKDGYHVEYTGSLFRFDDLGRDLIVRKGNRVLIVQCKYWSKEKEIHEKHIFQLFGTSICYQLDHPECQVSCVLTTNTVCSNKARSFANKMNVSLKENLDLGDFPRIKCNISDSGERIYHLPMDQQYDNVVIDKPGEFFAMTVQEAVDKGFRRAYRWHGT